MTATPVSAAPMALEFEDIRKTFRNDLLKPKRIVLKGVSFGMPQGKVTSLIGHNGAGKTTTIKILFGLMFPDSGLIRFNGRPLGKSDLIHFGYMPEINKLPLSLTPSEILSAHLRLMNQRPEHRRIMAALEAVDMGSAAHMRLGKMSKGMQRRIAWVQANIHDPKVLVLDEPFSGLDPFGKTMLQGWMQDMRAAGKTMLLCTHDIASIEALSDETVIMKDGALIYDSRQHPDPQAQSYEVTVSGIEAAEVQYMLSHLPSANHVAAGAGRLQHSLLFDDYGQATAALRSLLERGVIVRKFEYVGGRDRYLKTRLTEIFKRGV